jgi:formylglycine-generating enzyme required for sulfatase activity
MAPNVHALLPGIAEPFPGLRPFESDEEAIFRGRQKQADELLRRLAGHRFLAVVGTSGSGKSSLVKAGLLPALDRGYLAGTTSRWRIAVMRPGMAPIDNLSDALRGSGAQQASIEGANAATLRSSSLGLVETVRDAKLAEGESLLVVADQFEELFRYYRRMTAVDGGGEAAQFVQLLLTAARRPDAPVYVVLTMRSDFLGDCAQFPGLPEALSESQYLIPRLTREQRRQAIVEPLRLFGATMTPQLVEQLLNDSGDESADPAVGARYRGGAPDPLPVLQHALMRTYSEWKSLAQEKTAGPIDLPQYRDAGRMEAAIDQHAERLFTEELGDEGRRWVERIFRCLTTTELGRPVRRPTQLADLYNIVAAKDGDKEKIDAVLNLLRQRENSFVQLYRDGSVDISHESLIWKWKRLSGWVADEAASAELYRDLVKDASGKATWGEPKLSAALAVRKNNVWNADWAKQYSDGRFQDVEAFLSRSQKAARNQLWLRWFAVAAAVAVMILAVVAYYSRLAMLQKVKELGTVQIAQRSLASEQAALKEKLNGLNAAMGATQADRDRIAKDKSDLERQLSVSQQDSQKLLAQAQQSSMNLLVRMEALESQLAAAQRDRDGAVKSRQDADAKSAQLARSLETAQGDRDPARTYRLRIEVSGFAPAERTLTVLVGQMATVDVTMQLSVKARQDAEAKSAQPAKDPEGVPAKSTTALPPVGENVGVPAAKPTNDRPTRVTGSKDGLVYVWIPPGAFTMGCSPGDNECRDDERPSHVEKIANGFYMGQTEVTQAAWNKVKRENPSHFKGDQLPVENADWNQAAGYCKEIGGRLPTEKEWEYAARAGTTVSRYGALDAVAWHQGNSGNRTHSVGLKEANAFGLYDMLGNVWEWTDAKSGTKKMKVARGGSWDSSTRIVRASSSGGLPTTSRVANVGLRCVEVLR